MHAHVHPDLLEPVRFLLLLSSMDIRLQILQSSNTDLHQQLCKGFQASGLGLGLHRSSLSLVLKLPASWNEQLSLSCLSSFADGHCGTIQPNY